VSAVVEHLVTRLAATPREFVSPLDPSASDGVSLPAIVGDLFRARATRPLDRTGLELFRARSNDKASERHHAVVLIASWLLFDPAFQGIREDALLALLCNRLLTLADAVMPRAFIDDSERREEMVRTCLSALGILPPDETQSVFDDRLDAIDSVKRRALLAAARAKEAARDVHRRELARIRAQEEEERRQAARTTFED
jgi:hypothetical protein